MVDLWPLTTDKNKRTLNSGTITADDDVISLDLGKDTAYPVHEKTIELISDPPYPGNRHGLSSVQSGPNHGGVHIHVEQKTLQTLFEKIPWEDLVDSFNNKLTHKQEIRYLYHDHGDL